MDVRRELIFHVGALLLLNVLLAFGSIGLFVRMGPVIQQILEENVESIVAAEEILARLALPRSSPAYDEAERREIEGFLQRAVNNVTEEAERPVLAAISGSLPRAMDGDEGARRTVVTDLQTLIRINRDAMLEVDHEAQRLGRAGAWSAVFVGFLSLVLSLIVLARLRARLLLPLVELHDVLLDARTGGLRRCRPRPAPVEIRRIAESTNQILDERLRERTAAKADA